MHELFAPGRRATKNPRQSILTNVTFQFVIPCQNEKIFAI
jgi:hypothetical protein